jgi:flagellar biosynthesis component FlhA
MSDILGQIGAKVATKISSLSSRVSALESNDSYSETTYTDGLVSQISTWSTSSKSTLLQTKAFTYTNGLLTQILVTDGSITTELTQTLAYDSDGNLESITKDYA